jgi:thioredoxin 1
MDNPSIHLNSWDIARSPQGDYSWIMSKGISITGENFESEVLNSQIPVLIDFWADWCGPCRMIAPIIDQLAAEYESRIKVGKINVDQETALSNRHGIVSIPTLVVYKDGSLILQKVGPSSKQDIEGLFKDLV